MKRFYIYIILIFITINAYSQVEIKFAEKEYNFGENDNSKPLVHVFKCMNSGHTPLIIKEIVPSDPAIDVSFSKEPIPSNSYSDIVITYNVQKKLFMGDFKKTITVRSNAENGTVRLYISGTISNAPIPPKKEKKETNGFIWNEMFKDNMYGAEDSEGNVILETKYDYVKYDNANRYFMVKKGQQYGVYKENGEKLLPKYYDYILEKDAGFMMHHADSYGFADFNGNVVIPIERKYKDLKIHAKSPFGTYFTYFQDDRVGICNKKGDEVWQINFDNNVIEDGLHMTMLCTRITPFLKKGKFVVAATFTLTTDISEKRVSVLFDGNGKGVFNKEELENILKMNCYSIDVQDDGSIVAATMITVNDALEFKDVVLGNVSRISCLKNPLKGNCE